MAPVAALIVTPIPGVALRVHGDAAAARQLAMEYAPAGVEPSTADAVLATLDVQFVSKLPGARVEGHKTIRWAATLERTAQQHLLLRIALRGWPRWFGLSLVQGYLIEPALSLLAVEAGGVLLPAAAIVQDGAALLLIGRSGTGKSSVSMRALAAGMPLLGDDQVFVSGDGTCTRFPRRLRIYDDAARTAPGAVSRLPVRDRMGLLLRRAVRVATRGYVAPSLAIPIRALGGVDAPSSVPLGRVALLSRSGGESAALRVHEADVGEALGRSAYALLDQRRRLGRMLGDSWAEAIDAVASRERALLERAFASIPISAIEVPTEVGAARAIDALAGELGLP